MPPKPSSSLKKWLPAILLAVALHLVVIIVLWNSQKQTSPTANRDKGIASQSQADGDGTAQEAIEADGTDVVATLTETSSVGNPTDDKEDTDEKSDNNNKTAQDDDSDSEGSKSEQSTQTTTTADKTNVEKAASKQAEQAIVNNNNATSYNTSQAPLITSQNDTYRNANVGRRPQGNPNERLLLEDDVPKAQAAFTATADEQQYDKAAQEVEQINAQLSATINKVKEQKMREIKAQQERNKNLHLQDRQNQQGNRLNEQVAIVSKQLAVDKAAEAEFSHIQE